MIFQSSKVGAMTFSKKTCGNKTPRIMTLNIENLVKTLFREQLEWQNYTHLNDTQQNDTSSITFIRRTADRMSLGRIHLL